MEYGMYLKYDSAMNIALNGHWGDLYDFTWADIMYYTEKEEEEDEDKEENEAEDLMIGIFVWVTFNQALAKVNSVSMNDAIIPGNRKPLMELDYTNITQETIDEIGAASNPNIVMPIRFGIKAAWRNERLGEQVVKGFIEQMKGKCGYIIITTNTPAQFEQNSGPNSSYANQGIELDSLEKDPEKAQWKLNAFWQRCGFKQFKNYDNVFICNVDQAVPYPDEIAHTASQLT
jgi:hypothetical protein